MYVNIPAAKVYTYKIDAASLSGVSTYTSPTWGADAFREIRIMYEVGACVNIKFTYPAIASGYFSAGSAGTSAGDYHFETFGYVNLGVGAADSDVSGWVIGNVWKSGRRRRFSHSATQFNTTTPRVYTTQGGGFVNDTATDITSVKLDFGTNVTGTVWVEGIPF